MNRDIVLPVFVEGAADRCSSSATSSYSYSHTDGSALNVTIFVSPSCGWMGRGWINIGFLRTTCGTFCSCGAGNCGAGGTCTSGSTIVTRAQCTSRLSTGLCRAYVLCTVDRVKRPSNSSESSAASVPTISSAYGLLIAVVSAPSSSSKILTCGCGCVGSDERVRSLRVSTTTREGVEVVDLPATGAVHSRTVSVRTKLAGGQTSLKLLCWTMYGPQHWCVGFNDWQLQLCDGSWITAYRDCS